MDLTGYTAITSTPPDKGKNIIGVNEIESAISAVEHRLYRCMCNSDGCFKWRDSETGLETIIDVTHWKYV